MVEIPPAYECFIYLYSTVVFGRRLLFFYNCKARRNLLQKKGNLYYCKSHVCMDIEHSCLEVVLRIAVERRA